MIPFPLTEAEFAIGRNSDAQIHLEEKDVSRTHARVFRREGTWQLEDRKSSGGTFINGKRLLPEQPEILDHGDVIRVGSIKLQFENEAEASAVRRTKFRAGFEFCDDSESSIQGSAVNSGYGLLTVRPEEKLKGILKINEALAGNVDFRVICPRVLDALFEIFPQADRGAILFLETSEEAPPPRDVSRALRSYASMGILRRLSGILVGRPGRGVPYERFAKYDDAILKVVGEEEGLANLPIVAQMDFGHTDPMFVLPYGVMAQVDCDNKRLEIIETAVVD